MPILTTLFKYIVSNLSNHQQSNLKIHVLSVMFLLIEQYPKEAEENKFTSQAIHSVISQSSTRDTSVSVFNSICRGLCRLLISFSLSHDQRATTVSFATKKNKALQKFPVSNSLRSLLSLGLMITALYTGDEQKGTIASNDDEKY